MKYPYPELLSLLQLKCAPNEYQRIIAPFVRKSKYTLIANERLADPDYQAILPHYKYAQCPVCGHQLYSRADTYSLYGWQAGPILKQMLYPEGYWVNDMSKSLDYPVPKNYPPQIIESDVFNGTQKFAHCEHFMGIHLFANLHQDPLNTIAETGKNLSAITESGTNFGEVPYVSAWFFEHNVPSYVVLHATPVCCIENNQFIPSYTIFSLTYFTQDRKALIAEWKANEDTLLRNDDEYAPSLLTPPRQADIRDGSHDLADFAKRGLLGFLDFRRPNIPLVIGSKTILPAIYQNIQGHAGQFEWRDGKLTKFWW